MVVGLVACSGTQEAEPTSASSSGLSATATASTLFDTQRAFRLELLPAGPEVSITSLLLDSPWYEPVGAVERRVTLSEGGQRLVPLPYGEAVCGDGSPAPDDPVGTLVLETTDGVRRVPVGVYPGELVAGRHARECAVAAARAAVDLDFAPTWDDVGPRSVTGTLQVRPRDGAAVEVRRVEGNIIFTLEALEPLPATADGAPLDLPVEVSASRCDTHALIEAKNKTLYPVELALDGGEPVQVTLEVAGSTADRFQGLLEACLDEPDG